MDALREKRLGSRNGTPPNPPRVPWNSTHVVPNSTSKRKDWYRPGQKSNSRDWNLLAESPRVPGAWPSSSTEAESQRNSARVGFVPLDAHAGESPVYSTKDFVLARESPHLSCGPWSYQRSSAYSSSFHSVRPPSESSEGYTTALNSPLSSLGYVSNQPSLLQSPARFPRREEVIPEEPASEYVQLLRKKRLLLRAEQELNWSGRLPSKGQHVEFAKGEKIPLEEIGLIGCSLKAKIWKVKCRRITLARKSMVCGSGLKLEDALNEVEHLQRLRHAHIVRLVGSYVQGRDFSILIYPVAEYDLTTFLEYITTVLQDSELDYLQYNAVVSLGRFFTCLTNAMDYIHENTTKHMDIKPQNILVKEHPRYLTGHQVYLADFGISRHFTSLDLSQTDSEIAKTPKYCAPEVAQEERWGRSADIFSLGCVFLEIQTVLCRQSLDDFTEYRSISSGRESFQVNHTLVRRWADLLKEQEAYVVVLLQHQLKKCDRQSLWISMVQDMLSLEPDLRPTANLLKNTLQDHDCCQNAQEDFKSDPPKAWTSEPNRKAVFDFEGITSDQFFSPLENDKALLRAAVSNDHYAVVGTLLSRCSPHLAEVQFVSFLRELLLIAVLEETGITFQLLIEAGADPLSCGSATPPDESVFLFAVRRGQYVVVKYVLEKRKEAIDAAGRNLLLDAALLSAAKLGHQVVLQDLIEHGGDANYQDREGMTALHSAAMFGHEDVVQYLLEHGANPNACDKQGVGPLYAAVVREDDVLVRVLLDAGADPNLGNYGESKPLHVSLGLAFDAVFQRGDTKICGHEKAPLHKAVLNGNAEISCLLLDHGAHVDALDCQALTPLHMAVAVGNGKLIELLLGRGARKTSLNQDEIDPESSVRVPGTSGVDQYVGNTRSGGLLRTRKGGKMDDGGAADQGPPPYHLMERAVNITPSDIKREPPIHVELVTRPMQDSDSESLLGRPWWSSSTKAVPATIEDSILQHDSSATSAGSDVSVLEHGNDLPADIISLPRPDQSPSPGSAIPNTKRISLTSEAFSRKCSAQYCPLTHELSCGRCGTLLASFAEFNEHRRKIQALGID